MQCEFCKSGVGVSVGERWTICRLCKQVSKKCGKGSGQYYRIADGAKDAGTYLSGDELADVGAAVGRKALVFDFHNVVDRFTPEEFAEMIKPFADNHALFVLSYVGSTTRTRVEADADIRARMVLVPGLQGYLCFRRSDKVEQGRLHSCARGGKCLVLRRFGRPRRVWKGCGSRLFAGIQGMMRKRRGK